MKKFMTAMFICVSSVWGLNLMTEDYPPYNYPDAKGKASGISVDIVREIIKKTGDTDNIEVLPWARSYKKIQKQRDQVLFVMTRTPKRENLFKWVGPVAPNNWVLFGAPNSNIKLNSLEEAKDSKYTIGTYKNDACETFLKDKGFHNLASVPDDKLNPKKLKAGRIDLWIVGEYQGIIKAKNNCKNCVPKKILNVKDTQLYIAFSKDISDKIVASWQKELDILKSNGKYQKIMDKYLK